MGRRLRSIAGIAAALIIAVAAIAIIFLLQTNPGKPGALSATPVVAGVAPTAVSQASLPSGAAPAELVRIIDGDTIVVRFPGQSGQETVRLIGIDTPETKKPDTPVQCYGKEATSYTTNLLTGQKIWLERDVSDRDQYGRLLRYVWIKQGASYLLANEQIVALGYGTASDYHPDTRYHDRLFAALANARDQHLGMWGSCELAAEGTIVPGAPSWWTGGDLDCADFATQKDAQAFFEAMGGPQKDPHRLDPDGDGIVCRRLP